MSEKSLQGLEGKFSFATNWAQQFGVLLGRAWLQGTRDRLPVRITLIQSTFVAIVLGILYSNLKKDQKVTLGCCAVHFNSWVCLHSCPMGS